jgi:putative hydrolase of the HAD superfamily
VTQAWDALVAAAGVPAPALAAAVRSVAAELGMEMLEPLERGVLRQDEWGRRVTAALAPFSPRVDLRRLADHWYAGRRANTELLRWLGAVARPGARGHPVALGPAVRIGLLTNSVLEWEPRRRALVPDTDLFEARIKSHETGLRKPDPEIYELAERTFGTAPASCVLLDDTPANCDAARARGWSAVRHRTNRETIAALAALTGQEPPSAARGTVASDPG